jgi:hypothetical protein
MSDAGIEAAMQLIRDKQYKEAYQLLRQIDDPRAKRLAENLEAGALMGVSPNTRHKKIKTQRNWLVIITIGFSLFLLLVFAYMIFSRPFPERFAWKDGAIELCQLSSGSKTSCETRLAEYQTELQAVYGQRTTA